MVISSTSAVDVSIQAVSPELNTGAVSACAKGLAKQSIAPSNPVQ
jgi:hypothetical protein